jgi:hypothetical protein
VENLRVNFHFRWSSGLALQGLILPLLAAGGCGDRSGVGATWPVSGKVTLDGRPLTANTTVILFMPDAARGNGSQYVPSASVDQEGNYTLATKEKRGAPAGCYRVVVTAHEGTVVHPQGETQVAGTSARRPTVRTVAPAKYGQEASTDLLIEVVEEPADGAYDLRLKSS